jgi:TRAP transporter TAXI family solute receptor
LSGGNSVSLAFANGLSDMLNKYHPWIRASVTQVGGDEDSVIQTVGKDPTTVSMPNGFSWWGARYGVGGWTQAYPDLRLISGQLVKTMNMWSNDPNVRTLEDLPGKKVVGLTGSTTTKMLEAMLEEMGIRDQVDIQMLGYGAQFDSFRDRLTVNVLDSCTIDTTTNTGHIGSRMEEALFALDGEIYPVEWPPELIKDAAERLGMPYIGKELPSGVLETQDRPWHGQLLGGAHTYATWAQAREDVVYEVTKLFIEHIGELKEYHPFGAFVTAESIIKEGIMVDTEDDMHPGALKYYKEAGLWDMWPGPYSQR